MRIRAWVAGLAVAVVAAPSVAVAGTSAGTEGRQSRTSDTAVAGADIYLRSSHSHSLRGGACSLGFAVQRPHGRRAVVTAGHCVATLSGGPSYVVYQTASASHDRTDPGDRLGTVSKGHFHVGVDGDNALVALSHNRSARASVFTGGVKSTTTATVTGAVAPRLGLSVCYSGARSGEHCGFTIRHTGQTIAFPERGHIYRIHHEWTAVGGCTAAAGDSGSPVFVRHGGSVRAVGILSGGGSGSGRRCELFFTPLSLALRTLNATLLEG